MLAWTPSGAVARPRTLQLRLHRAYADRVPAGAPVPSRSLTFEEVEANLRWFTASSPRGLPVDALVLAGQGVAQRPDLPAIVALAHTLGIKRLTLHVSVEDLRALAPVPGVDRLVLPVRFGPGGVDGDALVAAFAGAGAVGARVDANVPLAAAALPSLAEATALAVAGGAASVTFSYPFPSGGPERPPSVAAAVAALAAAAPAVIAAGLPLTVKGLPACSLGPYAAYVRRSANRWYVDAEHQRDAALLFFPGVVAFAKGDVCRFCPADDRCDGSLAAWSSVPGNPPLRPLAS